MIAIGITVIICITIVTLVIINNESRRKDRIAEDLISNFLNEWSKTSDFDSAISKVTEDILNEKHSFDDH